MQNRPQRLGIGALALAARRYPALPYFTVQKQEIHQSHRLKPNVAFCAQR